MILNDKLHDAERIATSESQLNERLKESFEALKAKNSTQEKELAILHEGLETKTIESSKWQRDYIVLK